MNLQKENSEPSFDFVIPSDILDDLCCRFIVNVPYQEKKDLVRICFQVEQAHWFYLDFYSIKFNDTLRPCSLKEFAKNIFYHIHYLRPFIKDLNYIIDGWKEYKYSVPTFGAIILDEEFKNILLVKSYWSKSSWGFPKGKINKDETPCHCAAREVYEEIGFNISSLIHPDTFVETTINEQCIRLYIVSGVCKKTKFVPQTRNEIKEIKWFPIDYIPIRKKVKNKLYNTFYMVIPFMRDLRKWILQNGAPSVSKQRRSFKSFSEVEDLLHTTSIGPESNSTTIDENRLSLLKDDEKPKQLCLKGNAENEVECYEGSDEDDINIKQSNEEIYGIPKVKFTGMNGKELDYLSTYQDISLTYSFHQKNFRTKPNNLEPGGIHGIYEKDLLTKIFNSRDNYVQTHTTFISNKSIYQEKGKIIDKFDNSIKKNISSILFDKNTNVENHKNSKNVTDHGSHLNNVKSKGTMRRTHFKPIRENDKISNHANTKVTNHVNNPISVVENESSQSKFNESLPSGETSITNEFIQRINENKVIQGLKSFKFNRDSLAKALE